MTRQKKETEKKRNEARRTKIVRKTNQKIKIKIGTNIEVQAQVKSMKVKIKRNHRVRSRNIKRKIRIKKSHQRIRIRIRNRTKKSLHHRRQKDVQDLVQDRKIAVTRRNHHRQVDTRRGQDHVREMQSQVRIINRVVTIVKSQAMLQKHLHRRVKSITRQQRDRKRAEIISFVIMTKKSRR